MRRIFVHEVLGRGRTTKQAAERCCTAGHPSHRVGQGDSTARVGGLADAGDGATTGKAPNSSAGHLPGRSGARRQPTAVKQEAGCLWDGMDSFAPPPPPPPRLMEWGMDAAVAACCTHGHEDKKLRIPPPPPPAIKRHMTSISKARSHKRHSTWHVLHYTSLYGTPPPLSLTACHHKPQKLSLPP